MRIMYAKIEDGELIIPYNGYKNITGFTDNPEIMLANGFIPYQEDEHGLTLVDKYSSNPRGAEIIDGVLTDISETSEYISEIAQKEAERIARLHLTRGDVFRGLLQAKGVTRTQLRAMIEAMPDGIDKEMALIDFDEALEFYRGVSLIDTVGVALGISTEQMDRFFETNDYQKLNT